MKGYFCITGTPGTGKKTIAPAVASLLRVPCYGLTDLAVRYCMVDVEEAGEVDAVRLGRRLREDVSEGCVLFGHLIPYALKKCDVARAVVLRCEPAVLKARLKARGYSRAKIVGDFEAELIGVIATDSIAAFGHAKVSEFDNSTATPGEAAREVARLLSDSSARPCPVDWLCSYDSPRALKSLYAF